MIGPAEEQPLRGSPRAVALITDTASSPLAGSGFRAGPQCRWADSRVRRTDAVGRRPQSACVWVP